MLDLNVEFQEEYKALDNLCKDYLSCTDGVSEYIRQMEYTTWSDRQYCHSWEYDYRQLKHIRWIRNQLAHEVGTLKSDICTDDDLNWTREFRARILSCSDPFSVVRKEKEAAIAKKREEQAAKSQQTEAQIEILNQDSSDESPAEQSIWSKIKTFFANLFK